MNELLFKAAYFFGIKFPITKEEFLKVRKEYIFKYHSDKSESCLDDPDALAEVLELSADVLKNLDELNGSDAVGFSKDQIDYLVKLLTPECCHIFGHTHYGPDDCNLCSEQKAKAYDKLRNALGLGLIKPKQKYGCQYCK